jgi:hypothetical protein
MAGDVRAAERPGMAASRLVTASVVRTETASYVQGVSAGAAAWRPPAHDRHTARPGSRSCNGKDHIMASTRMLFTSRPLAGHFEPLVPLAVAARAAGHTVAFATGEPYTGRAREGGFEAFHAGPDEGFRNEWAPRFPGFDQLVGDAQRHFFLTEIFANLELVPRADDLGLIIDTWQPDVIVHELVPRQATFARFTSSRSC